MPRAEWAFVSLGGVDKLMSDPQRPTCVDASLQTRQATLDSAKRGGLGCLPTTTVLLPRLRLLLLDYSTSTMQWTLDNATGLRSRARAIAVR